MEIEDRANHLIQTIKADKEIFEVKAQALYRPAILTESKHKLFIKRFIDEHYLDHILITPVIADIRQHTFPKCYFFMVHNRRMSNEGYLYEVVQHRAQSHADTGIGRIQYV